MKTRGSVGDVPVDATTIALLDSHRAKATGPFVLESKGNEGGSRAWGQQYRCEGTFQRLLKWLRAHGLSNANKPIHTLRKEAGSFITDTKGIHAASVFLRHANLQVTSRHYANHKARATVDIGGMLTKAQDKP